MVADTPEQILYRARAANWEYYLRGLGEPCPRCHTGLIRVTVPCPEGRQGCGVHHFRIHCPHCGRVTHCPVCNDPWPDRYTEIYGGACRHTQPEPIARSVTGSRATVRVEVG